MIPIFHRVIQEQRLPLLLIDVADYSHVPGGPGVLLVAHEGFYSMEQPGERQHEPRERDGFEPGHAGLRFSLRRGPDGGDGWSEPLRAALVAALRGCAEIEREAGLGTAKQLSFESSTLEITVNDRLVDAAEVIDDVGRSAVALLAEANVGASYRAGSLEIDDDRPTLLLSIEDGVDVRELLARLAGAQR